MEEGTPTVCTGIQGTQDYTRGQEVDKSLKKPTPRGGRNGYL